MPEAEIETFRLGTEAVERLEQGVLRSDVIFSDIHMPGLSGLELTKQLKQLSPETKLIFVTGYENMHEVLDRWTGLLLLKDK